MTLAPAPGSLQIDATVGGGGHTERILEATDPDGRLLGLDADGAAIARVDGRLRPRFGDRLVLRQGNFRDLATIARDAGFEQVDGALFDLGLSSYQLADTDRGFGFRAGGPLDMRFDASRGVPASELLASLDANELTALFRRYGEEPKAGRIARAIVDARRTAPIAMAEELAALVERVLPPPAAPDAPRHASLPGAADRGERGARRTPGRPHRRPRPAPARWPPGGPQLPLPRGPHRQALPGRRAAWLRLSPRDPGVRLWPESPLAPPYAPVADPDGRGDRREPTRPKRPDARRGAPGRMTATRATHPRTGRRSPR